MTERKTNSIDSQASVAIKTIAAAASEATNVIANAAGEAAKVLSLKTSVDHDLLIELKTRMDSLKDDIKDLKDGTTVKIADHEVRLFNLENGRTKINTLISIGVGLLSLLVGLLLYHIVGVKI